MNHLYTQNTKYFYVWWLKPEDVELLEDVNLPTWLQTEVNSANGRNGRGRLWLSVTKFPHTGINAEFPETATPLSRHCEACAGIVITSDELPLLGTLPGIVTDLKLNRLLVLPKPPERDHGFESKM